jgi:hypothetical protein
MRPHPDTSIDHLEDAIVALAVALQLDRARAAVAVTMDDSVGDGLGGRQREAVGIGSAALGEPSGHLACSRDARGVAP